MNRSPERGSIIRYWPWLYGAVLLAGAALSHFAVLSNDVFPLRWQAEHLSFAHPESFYNGFFPIGYPLLLRIANITGNPVLTMMLVQIALSPLYALLAYRFLRAMLPELQALLALPFILFAPQIVRPILSPTPDFFAMLAVLWGLMLFLSGDGNRAALLSGVAFGIASLFRSHVLVFFASLFVVLLAMERKNMRTVLFFVAGFAPFVLLQGFVQVWSGHGFFENAQVFNIWKNMHDMDWNNPPDLRGQTVLGVIMSDPGGFMMSYMIGLIYHLAFLLPLILYATLMAVTSQGRRTWGIIIGASILYLFVTSFGSSPRDVAIIIPVVGVSAMNLLRWLLGRTKLLERRQVVLPLVVVISFVAIGGLLYAASVAGRRIDRYTELQSRLAVHSRTDALQVYTDDFDLYFPGLRYASPRKSGGWAEIGLPDYQQAFPHVRDSTAAMEHADLTKLGVRWAVYRIPPYDGRGHDSVQSDTSLFKLAFKTALHAVYRVQ